MTGSIPDNLSKGWNYKYPTGSISSNWDLRILLPNRTGLACMRFPKLGNRPWLKSTPRRRLPTSDQHVQKLQIYTAFSRAAAYVET